MATRTKAAPTVLAMDERELQNAIIEFAQRSGWQVMFIPDWVWKLVAQAFARGRRGDREWAEPGFPDLVLLQGLRDRRQPVRLIFAELKTIKGTVREPQMRWLLGLSRVAGVETYVLRPNDWRDGTVDRILLNGPMPEHPGTQEELVRARRQLAKKDGDAV